MSIPERLETAEVWLQHIESRTEYINSLKKTPPYLYTEFKSLKELEKDIFYEVRSLERCKRIYNRIVLSCTITEKF